MRMSEKQFERMVHGTIHEKHILGYVAPVRKRVKPLKAKPIRTQSTFWQWVKHVWYLETYFLRGRRSPSQARRSPQVVRKRGNSLKQIIDNDISGNGHKNSTWDNIKLVLIARALLK